jgi:hypothetical protein
VIQREVNKRLEGILGYQDRGDEIGEEEEDGLYDEAVTPRSSRSRATSRYHEDDDGAYSRARSRSPELRAAYRHTRKLEKLQRPYAGLSNTRCVPVWVSHLRFQLLSW